MNAPKTPRGIRIHPNISETRLPGPMPVEHIPIAEINRDPTIQQQAGGVSAALVSEYAETIGEWIERAPLTVYREDRLAWIWLADGFHRAEAAARAGLLSVPCVVHPGGYRAALLCACGANAAHGARRTREDRRRAVETLLKDSEWSCWSDRKIAETAGVSPTTVGTLRAQLSNLDSCQGADTNTAALLVMTEERGAVDESPVMTAAPDDTAAPTEARLCPLALPQTPEPALNQTSIDTASGAAPNLPPPFSETAPAPKRIGRDGKARAAPVPKDPKPETDTNPGYPRTHATAAGKLIKKAQLLALAIGNGESLDITLQVLEEARVIADALLDKLLRLRDQQDRAQAADFGEWG